MQTHSSKHILFYFILFHFTSLFVVLDTRAAVFLFVLSLLFLFLTFTKKTNFANLNNINITFDRLEEDAKKTMSKWASFRIRAGF